MKKQFFLSVIIASTFVACNTTPKGDTATISETQEVSATEGNNFTVDNSISTIYFTGNGVGKNHPGTFKLSEGNLTVTDSKISAGNFVINIASLGLDEEAEMIQTKLKNHLLSPDFFDAEKFSTAKFEITKVEDYKSDSNDKTVVESANAVISGNLTLKDATKNVTFPANVTITETEITAKANFNLDRSTFGMNYGNDKSLKDKFISPEVNIKIDIKAKK